MSTPAPRRYRLESEYYLGPDSDNERDLTDDEDNEVERLMDQTERLLDNIHRKLNNLLEADTDKDYDADSEDF